MKSQLVERYGAKQARDLWHHEAEMEQLVSMREWPDKLERKLG